MNTLIKIMFLLFAALPLSIAIANEDISGTWEGNLAIGPDTKMTIQFVITKAPDGSYAAFLNTPDEGNVKDVAANEVVYDAGSLKIDVAELSGSYNGVVKDGKIEGEWEQMGTSFPLILKPYAKPTLSKEDMDMLLGAWQGKPVFPEGVNISMGDGTYVFLFEMSDQGEFTGTFTEAGMGTPGQPLADMGISDGIFTFTMRGIEKFKGEITGNKIVGVIKTTVDDGPSFPDMSLTLVKGEYKAPDYNLNLPEEIKDQLTGKWNTTLLRGPMSMPLEFRFETSENGDFLGFVSMPEFGTSESYVTGADMSDGKLSLELKSFVGEFKGEISADKIVGEWTDTGMGMESSPMTLNRGPYVAPVYTLSLPEESMDQLAGNWNGKFNDMDVIFRFEKDESGDFKGAASLPMFGPNDSPIEDASLSEGKLILKIKGSMSVEYTGELSGDKLDGDLKMPMGDKIHLTLDREKL